jgi:ribosomal-protein-alanine N-acetyltransferase
VISWPQEFPQLAVGDYILRKPALSDKPRFVEMIVGDADIHKFTTVPDPYDESHADSKLGGVDEYFSSKSGIEFVIADLHNQLVGQVALWGANHFDHFISVGYMMHPQYRGRGIMSAAVQAAAEYALSLGFRRVQADVMVENIGSQRTLEKAGFTREARLKYYATERDGTQSDSFIYSICR